MKLWGRHKENLPSPAEDAAIATRLVDRWISRLAEAGEDDAEKTADHWRTQGRLRPEEAKRFLKSESERTRLILGQVLGTDEVPSSAPRMTRGEYEMFRTRMLKVTEDYLAMRRWYSEEGYE